MLIELLSNYGLFLLKTITIVVSILLIISAIINSKKSNTDVNLTVKNINIELDELEKSIKIGKLSDMPGIALVSITKKK